jgi:hypothetical protein
MARPKPPADKIPVTRRALAQRLARALQAKGQAVVRHGGKDVLVDEVAGKVLDRDCDVEKLAREVGALKTWEVLG